MTTPKTPPERPADATGAPAGTPDQGGKQGRRDDRVRSEYRKLQAEHDVLTSRYGQMVEAEVHRLLGSEVTDVAAALKVSDKTSNDFVGADGAVDVDAVHQFASDFTRDHPAFRSGLPVLSGDTQRKVTKDRLVRTKTGPGWAELLASPGRSGED